MESTGTYHELFANTAHQLGLSVFVLNPKDARHYARAVGLRGKTDRVDAELIARMIAHEHAKLHAWIPPTPEQREMARLIKRRAKLSSLRQALGMTLRVWTDLPPISRRSERASIRQLRASTSESKHWSRQTPIANNMSRICARSTASARWSALP